MIMGNNLENEAVTAAHRRASAHAQRLAKEAADKARSAVVAAYSGPDRWEAQDRGDVAWDRAYELTYTPAFQAAYDSYLPHEWKRVAEQYSQAQKGSDTVDSVSRRGERRY